jgi:Family of unknown function (DUF6152)
MRTWLLFIVGAVVMLAATRGLAHHAFTAEFDANKPVTLEGAVSKVEWVNPHSWIHVDVKGSDGKMETWMIEAGTPNVLLRRGFNKTMLAVGAVITVRGFQAKNGALRANGGDLRLPDGRVLLLGSPGSGSPFERK